MREVRHQFLVVTTGMRREFRGLLYKHCSSDQPRSSSCLMQYLNYLVLLPLHPLIILCKLFHLIARDLPNIGDLRIGLVGGFFRGNHQHSPRTPPVRTSVRGCPSQHDFVTLFQPVVQTHGAAMTYTRRLKFV